MAINPHTLEMTLRVRGEDTDIDLGVLQGLWTDEQYIRLTNQTNRLIEFTDGFVEMLPMPTDKHQTITQFVFLALVKFFQHLNAKIQFAPLRLQIRAGKHREPDLLLVCDAHDPRRQNRF